MANSNQDQVTTPVVPMTIIFGSNSFVKIMLSATAGAFVGFAKFFEDSIQLANNEVGILEGAQKIRIDEIKDERQKLKDERQKTKSKSKSTT